MDEISQEHPIFSGMEVGKEIVVVGSIKESSKVGELDEADCLLLLKKKYNEYLFFDENTQDIKESPKFKKKTLTFQNFSVQFLSPITFFFKDFF